METAHGGDANFHARILGLTQEAARALDDVPVDLVLRWTGCSAAEELRSRILLSATDAGLVCAVVRHARITAFVAGWAQTALVVLARVGFSTLGDLLQRLPATSARLREAAAALGHEQWSTLCATTAESRGRHNERSR